MLKKIVVPLDGSDLAKSALPWAKLFSGHTGCDVDLISAIPDEDSGYDNDDLEKHLNASASDLESGGFSANVHVEAGSPPSVIASHARNVDADLIVMASHGRTGVLGRLMGSVSFWVLRLAITPIMIIKPDSGEASVSMIMFPMDGRNHGKKGIVFAADMAKSLGVPLTITHVSESSYRAPKPVLDAEASLKSSGIDVALEIDQGDPRDLVTASINRRNGVLAVLESTTATGIDLAQIGSFAEHLFVNTLMPTVVIPSENVVRTND